MTDSKYAALDNDSVLPDAVALPVSSRVEIVAPESLPGGYELHCEVQGQPAIVRVPPEGVYKGQRFVGIAVLVRPHAMVTAEKDDHQIPTGSWRDGCCACFKHGYCHPMLCLACWFPPLALGQVMTRMHLNGVGSFVDEDHRHLYCSAFKVLAIVFALYIGIDQLMSALLNPYEDMLSYEYDSDTGEFIEPDYSLVPTWVLAVIGVRYGLQIVFGLYMFVLLVRTRSHVRRRYKIKQGECYGCEDCCCAFWAPCCTTLQIARHTADYEKYPAACCTETGLPSNIPHVV